jgi:L-seryl-tRNA(Ser) seleniumtransferase
METTDNLFRLIPSLEAVLQSPGLGGLLAEYGREYLSGMLRSLFQDWKNEIAGGRLGKEALQDSVSRLPDILAGRIERDRASSLVRVINATGIIIHTNLGRAPLPRAAFESALELASRYSNLEYDLEAGGRGKRDVHAEQDLTHLLGAEACTVVNNNAAAVLLVLNTLADGKETLVSRGELVEIGGSFRIPDIMRKSGSILAEVGTTNRTRLEDYEKRISDKTGLILKVHLSNFRIVGFTDTVPLAELVGLGRRRQVPVAGDQGTGNLIDLTGMGIHDEPTVQETLAAGADVVTFSGDKILGGPQAGIIVGKREYLEKIRRNPLYRTMRPDKVTLSLLHGVLRLYIEGREDRIPVVRMFRMSQSDVRGRAGLFVKAMGRCKSLVFSLEDGESKFGGGTVPLVGIPTVLVSVASPHVSAAVIEARLRKFSPPIIARIAENKVLIDLRTVEESEEEPIRKALRSMD